MGGLTGRVQNGVWQDRSFGLLSKGFFDALMSLSRRQRACVRGALPLLMLALSPGQGLGQTLVYESDLAVRQTGTPVVLEQSFSVAGGGNPYMLVVQNGPQGGKPITSAEIRLNGQVIVAPGDFRQKLASIERPVALLPDNEIRIQVRGAPGSSLKVSITGEVRNTPPTAEAGPDRTVSVGDTVALDGSASRDPDNDPLTYRWQFIRRPAGSGATLSDPGAVNPSFVADQAGTYDLELVVSDGSVESAADTVAVTAEVGGPPVLRIGSVRAAEGSASGSTEYGFVVTLSTALADPVTVDYETADYSAAAGEDYESAAGTLTIPAGQTTVELRVRVLGDGTPEGDEQFAVVLGNPSAGAELSSGNVGVGTIVDDDTPPIATANLANDSTYVGAGGVTIRTLANTLSRPIQVSVAEVGAPAEPLDAGLVLRGGYYRLQAHGDTTAANGSLFVLSLPVPAGANTAALALATLTPGSRILDWPGTDPVWVTTPGVYDPAANMFRTVLPFLPQQGYIMALVEQPDFVSPAATTSTSVARLSATAAAADPAPNDVVYEGFDFYVECEGFSVSTPCSDLLKRTVAIFLEITRGELRSLGYPEPWLIPNITPNSLTSNLRPRADGWKVFVSPSGSRHCKVDGKPVNGLYHPDLFKLVLCAPSNLSINVEEVRTLVHEYFHATQFGEPLVRNGGEEDWIIESTATTAEKSTQPTNVVTKMNRSEDYQPRRVDIGLLDAGTWDDRWEYEAQDFWVYAGRVPRARDLGALTLLFALGADNDAADFTLRRVFGSSLGDMYWEWARNQAYEKGERFPDATGGNEVLGPPCRIEDKTVVTDTIIVEPAFNYEIQVKPLSSVMVKFRSPLDQSWKTWWRNAYPTSDPSDIRVKFYNVDGSADCGDSIDEGSRIIKQADPGDYYVLISNLNTSRTQGVRIDGDAEQ